MENTQYAGRGVSMPTLEQEIIDKFRHLDKSAQRRIRALIERETETEATDDDRSWEEFISATYGLMADDPMDEIDNSHLPPPVRDEVE
jgi:hypothetical protein